MKFQIHMSRFPGEDRPAELRLQPVGKPDYFVRLTTPNTTLHAHMTTRIDLASCVLVDDRFIEALVGGEEPGSPADVFSREDETFKLTGGSSSSIGVVGDYADGGLLGGDAPPPDPQYVASRVEGMLKQLPDYHGTFDLVMNEQGRAVLPDATLHAPGVYLVRVKPDNEDDGTT